MKDWREILRERKGIVIQKKGNSVRSLFYSIKKAIRMVARYTRPSKWKHRKRAVRVEGEGNRVGELYDHPVQVERE